MLNLRSALNPKPGSFSTTRMADDEQYENFPDTYIYVYLLFPGFVKSKDNEMKVLYHVILNLYLKDSSLSQQSFIVWKTVLQLFSNLSSAVKSLLTWDY